jgi:hypothetical protein
VTCPTCHKQAQTVRTVIRRGQLVTGCKNCTHTTTQQPHALAAKNRREQQKKDYRKDLAQPSQKRAWAEAYPEQAREMWGDDEFRKLV